MADIFPVIGLPVKGQKKNWADIDINDVEFGNQETIAEESDTQPAFDAYLDLTREAGKVIYQESENREDNDLSMAKRKDPPNLEMEETMRNVAIMAAQQACGAK